MSEPSLTKLAAPSDRMVYRSVSLFAVLGFACNAVFAGLAVVFMAGAILQDMPPLMSRWLLLIPGVGVVVCLLALRFIGLSEGTQTGEKLSYVGIWLAIVSGLGYFAYDYGSEWALTRQANNFLSYIDKNAPNDSGFFEHIQNGDTNRAFLLTKTNLRRGAKPDDQQQMNLRFDAPVGKDWKGMLTQFNESEIVYILKQAGGNLPVPQGVKSWDYKNGSYTVERNYQISSPEFDYHFLVKVASSQKGQERIWEVQWPIEGLKQSRRTELGINIAGLRAQSGMYFIDWCNDRKPKAFPKDLTNWEQLYLPNEAFRKPLRQAATEYFQGNRDKYQAEIASPGLTPWKRTKDGKLQIEHTFKFLFYQGPQIAKAQFFAEGRAVIQSRTPVDPHETGKAGDWHFKSYEIVKLRREPTPTKETMSN